MKEKEKSDIPELKMVILPDGDIVEIHGPYEDPTSAYTYYYQNRDTRELDEKFEMDGEPFFIGDPRYNLLLRSTEFCSLGKSEVETTLRYFIQVARRVGLFVGFREDEVKKEMRRSPELANRLDLGESINYKDGTQGPYLVRKIIDNKAVLFPRNLPKFENLKP